jgi:adenylosuccinate lyase
MIPRYTPAEYAELWSAKARYDVWLEVELAACDAMEEQSLLPTGTSPASATKLVLDVDRIGRSRDHQHDVIAFLTAGDRRFSARCSTRASASADVRRTASSRAPCW